MRRQPAREHNDLSHSILETSLHDSIKAITNRYKLELEEQRKAGAQKEPGWNSRVRKQCFLVSGLKALSPALTERQFAAQVNIHNWLWQVRSPLLSR